LEKKEVATFHLRVLHVTGFRPRSILSRNYNNPEEIRAYSEELFKNYDVVLHGFFMSELFNKYEDLHKGEDYFENQIERCSKNCEILAKRCPMIYHPAYDLDVQKQLRLLPIIYRRSSSIQRKIIILNQPDLLRFPLTCYNTKVRLVRWIYWRLIDALEILVLK